MVNAEVMVWADKIPLDSGADGAVESSIKKSFGELRTAPSAPSRRLRGFS
jgi:hypothetical protein